MSVLNSEDLLVWPVDPGISVKPKVIAQINPDIDGATEIPKLMRRFILKLLEAY